MIKKINHNTVLIKDEGIEKIAMGKGIGFSAVVNRPLDDSMVDKIFVLDTKEKTKRFSEIVQQIPVEFIEFAEKMIQFISQRIKAPLDSNIYIALTDHIYFAIQRKKEDSQLSAIMVPEMKLFYPEEYTVAVEVVNKMNHTFHTDLGINEVAFITMHIINAELSEKNSLNSLRILEMTSTIMQYLEDGKIIIEDKESLVYQRLMIHVKYLVKRLIYQEVTSLEDVSFFSETFRETESYRIAIKVKELVQEKYHIEVQENEVIYLAMHLARIK